jgi:hypothetical protein
MRLGASYRHDTTGVTANPRSLVGVVSPIGYIAALSVTSDAAAPVPIDVKR